MKTVTNNKLRATSDNHHSLAPSSLFSLLLSPFFLLLSPLSAQTLNADYNPYEYAQEELFLTSFGIRERYESEDCATANLLASLIMQRHEEIIRKNTTS
jgi:hypothetical protein